MSKRGHAKRLALYNHKGGVGKTTLAVNIAITLAGQGHRVLVVDSDPQCNLTAQLVEASVVDDLLDRSDHADGQTLWSAVKPIVEGAGGLKMIQPLERREGLFLLPGDIRLSEFENELNQYWTECFQQRPRGFRGTAALSDLVSSVCVANKIDIVFYDVGPNIGPLNRAIILDCDGFIIPVACDLFSVRALKTLGHSLATWIEAWETVSELAPANVSVLPGHPSFLGYIPQRFRTYGGDVASSYTRWFGRLEKEVANSIVTRLRQIDPSLAIGSLSSFRLGQVKEFSTLVTLAQEQGVPLAEVSGAPPYQKSQAEESFELIAKKILVKLSGQEETN